MYYLQRASSFYLRLLTFLWIKVYWEEVELMRSHKSEIMQIILEASDQLHVGVLLHKGLAGIYIYFFLASFQIVHLKRFIFVNNRWVKSNKIVHFPMSNFDLSEYVVGRRWRTISAAMMTDETLPTPSNDVEEDENDGEKSTPRLSA